MNLYEIIAFIICFIMISLENEIGWIAKNLNPEDVFSEGDLEKWASSSGYKKELSRKKGDKNGK